MLRLADAGGALVGGRDLVYFRRPKGLGETIHPGSLLLGGPDHGLKRRVIIPAIRPRESQQSNKQPLHHAVPLRAEALR